MVIGYINVLKTCKNKSRCRWHIAFLWISVSKIVLTNIKLNKKGIILKESVFKISNDN